MVNPHSTVASIDLQSTLFAYMGNIECTVDTLQHEDFESLVVLDYVFVSDQRHKHMSISGFRRIEEPSSKLRLAIWFGVRDACRAKEQALGFGSWLHAGITYPSALRRHLPQRSRVPHVLLGITLGAPLTR